MMIANLAFLFALIPMPPIAHALTDWGFIMATQAGFFTGLAIGSLFGPARLSAPSSIALCLPMLYAILAVSPWYAVTVLLLGVAGTYQPTNKVK